MAETLRNMALFTHQSLWTITWLTYFWFRIPFAFQQAKLWRVVGAPEFSFAALKIDHFMDYSSTGMELIAGIFIQIGSEITKLWLFEIDKFEGWQVSVTVPLNKHFKEMVWRV